MELLHPDHPRAQYDADYRWAVPAYWRSMEATQRSLQDLVEMDPILDRLKHLTFRATLRPTLIERSWIETTRTHRCSRLRAIPASRTAGVTPIGGTAAAPPGRQCCNASRSCRLVAKRGVRINETAVHHERRWVFASSWTRDCASGERGHLTRS